MDKAELLEYLRENLKIELETSTVSDWGSKGFRVTTRLTLEGEMISEQSDTIDIETRDTSETWRRTLD